MASEFLLNHKVNELPFMKGMEGSGKSQVGSGIC